MIERVAVLCSDEPHHNYLIGLLESRFRVELIVREPMKQQRARALRERRWSDYFYASYHNLRRTLLGLNSYRQKYFEQAPAGPCGRSCELHVKYINDPQVSRVLQKTAPDLTIVMSTSILKQDVLQAAGPRIVNIHGGYLPFYRGNHCFFFALYNRDFGKIASTIHFIDSGIDTGDLIELVVPRVRRDDTAEMLYCRAEKMAIHRLLELMESIRHGGEFPRTPQPFRGTLYRTRDRKIWHDLHSWFRRITGFQQRLVDEWNRHNIEASRNAITQPVGVASTTRPSADI